ncbi:hypothetical protein N8I71_00580 [Roseibacterium sp. SDUM158016]|uniref:methyltransferase domain-containing protein n=1 Tax=Roseicyclus sediminis TaxID=2980997 RepID=UPI0021D3D175|nr:methyltransferase domain-containing protein [Roseibacterium sp. SDUM158016]MCU4651310.1 hypothetical protein [Roseibacterium sp. SDUM158016]
MRRILDRIVRPFGLRVIKARHAEMVYQHEYSGGYAQYRDVQIQHNKRKLSSVWADEKTLGAIAADLRAHGLGATGVCHGARNGYEVEWFRRELQGDVIGTDISETATDFPNMHVWDFQDENPDWAGKFDFVYTNSLDQAMEPQRALSSWARQLTPKGRIYIEHTMAHSAQGAGEMDPFGAHPMAMPYLFFTWGRREYALADILEVGKKQNNRHRAWVFVLERAQS